jgi:hypothetical protein
MKATGHIDAVFKKYGLKKNITPEVQLHFIQARKRVLTSILKETGEYSFITGRALSIFYFCKRIGISISLFKASLIWSLILLLLISSLGYGGYRLTQQLRASQVPDSLHASETKPHAMLLGKKSNIE